MHVPQLADKESNVDMTRMKPGMSFLQVKTSMKMQKCHMCQLERDSPHPAGSCSRGRQPAQAHRYVWERALGCQFKGSSLFLLNFLFAFRYSIHSYNSFILTFILSFTLHSITQQTKSRQRLWASYRHSRKKQGT
jgi:hypothetical protein